MSGPPILIFSCSLNPVSRSRKLAEAAAGGLREIGEPSDLIDLREIDLPLCDGGRSIGSAAELAEKIAAARGVLIAAPIYNYDVNAAAKNLIELTGSAWENKVVGFLCAAGGRSSYMSPMGLASNLMLDFRCWIVPRFVYASRADFAADGALSPSVRARIGELAVTLANASRALAPSTKSAAGAIV